jgi:sulfur carrier protein ThiS
VTTASAVAVVNESKAPKVSVLGVTVTPASVVLTVAVTPAQRREADVLQRHPQPPALAHVEHPVAVAVEGLVVERRAHEGHVVAGGEVGGER